ncbi:hypothetical protein [Methanolobus sp. WCC5]|uniref:hypothetical protein n=1 Tax=Methanolobus sp. WCC5 TaxID=3125785 RepID=UPI00324A2283
MAYFDSLHYPYSKPPKKWMRDHLLFFDAVSSIIPKDDEIKSSDWNKLKIHFNKTKIPF